MCRADTLVERCPVLAAENGITPRLVASQKPVAVTNRQRPILRAEFEALRQPRDADEVAGLRHGTLRGRHLSVLTNGS